MKYRVAIKKTRTLNDDVSCYIYFLRIFYIYIYIYIEREREREEIPPCSMTFIKELFLGPGCLLNLTSPFSQKQKTKKKLDFSKTD